MSYNSKSVEKNKNTQTRASSVDPQVFIERNICPICRKHYSPSAYLATIFADNPKALFIANLVTHYRHHHIASWNKCWGPYGNCYMRNWFRNYEEEKQKVNERAKRQIIRKAYPVLIALGITSETFKCLQNTDKQTRELAVKMLDSNKTPCSTNKPH